MLGETLQSFTSPVLRIETFWQIEGWGLDSRSCFAVKNTSTLYKSCTKNLQDSTQCVAGFKGSQRDPRAGLKPGDPPGKGKYATHDQKIGLGGLQKRDEK